jgi:aminoglycoside phosphotransferase
MAMGDALAVEDLSREQAAALLAALGDVSVTAVRRTATSNDVWRVETAVRGNYYVKVHTARWYDGEDAYFVVRREEAVLELLRKRGLAPAYDGWGDYTRMVLPRAVFVCGELPGVTVPAALDRWPSEQDAVLRSLGRYVRRLHSIEFARAGLVSGAHAHFAGPEGIIPPAVTWDDHAMHHPEHLRRDAVAALDAARNWPLDDSVDDALRDLFDGCVEVTRDDYEPPRFTVGNCHAHHFHVERAGAEWRVTGFYDLEAVSAGDTVTDLVELEVTLTPALGSCTWRDAFFEGYGERPSLEGYKPRLFYYLLVGRYGVRDWPTDRWRKLMRADTWSELDWSTMQGNV